MSLSQSLGVDIAKHTLQTDDGQHRHVVPNQPAALQRWLRSLPAGTQLICEPTGGYERLLLTQAHQAGVSASLVNARHVRAFARGLGRLEKTDRLDAAVLRHYGACVQPRPLPPPDPALLSLQQWTRTRAHYAALRQAEHNRLELLEDPDLRRLTQQQCAHWDRLILKLDAQINDHVEAHPAVRDRVQTLCLVCGVGAQTALTLVAEFPELGRLPPRAAAKLAGLAPLSHDSGQWQGRRHIAHGRAPVRRALFQAALVAARHNEHLRPFYLRLRANGKPPKVALIAVARKLLIFLNRTLKEPPSPQL
jgi:transposase